MSLSIRLLERLPSRRTCQMFQDPPVCVLTAPAVGLRTTHSMNTRMRKLYCAVVFETCRSRTEPNALRSIQTAHQ